MKMETLRTKKHNKYHRNIKQRDVISSIVTKNLIDSRIFFNFDFFGFLNISSE